MRVKLLILKTSVVLLILITILCSSACSAGFEESSKLELEGRGTSEEPYRIFSAEELFQIASIINSGDKEASGAYYILENDIDLENQEWTPIGYYHREFSVPQIVFQGSWNGNSHTISNLRISLPKDELTDEKGRLKTMSIGFFSILGDNAVVKNLKINGASILREGFHDGYYAAAGSLAGINQGGRIANCHVTEFAVALEEFDKEVGGLIGVNSGDVVNSSVQYNMEVSEVLTGYSGMANIGGFCGLNSGKIKKSDSEGAIHVTGKESSWIVGGFVGLNDDGFIEDCQSTGRIENMEEYIVAGGMCGTNIGEITKSVVREVTIKAGANGSIGEFVSTNSGKIAECTCYLHPNSENPLIHDGYIDPINIVYFDDQTVKSP